VGTAELVLSSAHLLFRVRVGVMDTSAWMAIGWADLDRVICRAARRRSLVSVNLVPRPEARLASVDAVSGEVRCGAADAVLDAWFVLEVSPSLAATIVRLAEEVGATVSSST
jgi:hypothetical protein